MYLADVDNLKTLSDLPYSIASVWVEGFNSTVTLAALQSLTAVTTNFQPLFRLQVINILRTRLTNANLSSTFSLAPVLTTINMSFNKFTSIPQLPSSTTSLTMTNNQINSQPTSPTFFPTTLTTLNIGNLTNGDIRNIIPVWSHNLSYVTNLRTLTIDRVNMTSFTAPLPANIGIVTLSTNLLTSFDASVFSASTGLSYSVAINLGAQVNDTLATLTGLTNCGTLSGITTSRSSFPNQNAIASFTSSTFSSNIKFWKSTYNVTTLSTWNKPFPPLMNSLTLNRHGLNQASVDYILCWFYSGSTVNGGTLNLSNSGISNCSTGNANCNSLPSGNSNGTTLNSGYWCMAQLTGATRSWTVNVENIFPRLI